MALRTSVLFLCNGNSCRSKIAEAWTRELFPEIDAYSAGLDPHPLNPYVLKAMLEKNIDLSLSTPRRVESFMNKSLDYVITVCDRTNESCQVNFASSKVLHKNFDGPSKVARTKETEEEKLNCYRQVRDEIYTYILQLPELLALKCTV